MTRNPVGLALDSAQQEVVGIFQNPRYSGYLVVSQSPELGYLATVYSPLRSWCSHRYNTPDALLRLAQLGAFFGSGVEPPASHSRALLAVTAYPCQSVLDRLANAGFHVVFENNRFAVLARPQPPATSLRGEAVDATGFKCSSRRRTRRCSAIP